MTTTTGVLRACGMMHIGGTRGIAGKGGPSGRQEPMAQVPNQPIMRARRSVDSTKYEREKSRAGGDSLGKICGI
ncbi:MAG: hypothetical protein QM775_10660 [Pirellulales bacterium]